MKRLPVFLSLEGKKLLVVGGGNAAFIKIKDIVKSGGNLTVISEIFLEEVESFLKKESITYGKRKVLKKDLLDVFLVFAAADKQTNDMIYMWAKEKNILCCKADGKGDFIVPAHKREGSLTVAVSTDGKFPLLGKKICNEVDLEIAKKLDDLAEKRKEILCQIKQKKQQKEALEALLKE